MACCKKRTLPPPVSEGPNRERWCSRGAFIITALAATVAFSSVWRFPWLSYQFGGGVFLIPYVAALIFVGIPLLTLEFSLGQVFQAGNVVAFGSISKRLRGLGFASLYAGFMVATYYSVLVAYAGFYFVNSFWNPIPYSADVNSYFYQTVLHYSAQPTGIIAANLFVGLIVTWALIYLCIYKGPELTGKIVPATFFLSIGMLAGILGFSLTLPGGMAGLWAYLGAWDFTQLENPVMWSQAVTQSLFSVGVTFGVMSTYASYNNHTQGAVADSVMVAIFNALISCFCGLTVFTILGVMSAESGTPLFELVQSQIALAFLTYPTALSMLPMPQLWCGLFFASLFFLGLNPIFSLTEATITSFKDSKDYKNVPRYAICSTICAIGLAISTAYCQDIGITLIGAMDHYINNYLMLLVAFAETISVGWIYCADMQRKQIGSFPTIFMGLTYFASILSGITCSLLLQSQYDPFPASIAFWWGAVVGAGVFLLGFIISIATCRAPHENSDEVMHSKMWWLLMSNPEMARSDINSVIAKRGCSIGVFWSILMKYLLPLGFGVMFAINCQQDVSTLGFDNAVYSAGYQIFGLSAAGFGAFLIALGVVAPATFSGLMPESKIIEELEVEEDALIEKQTMIGGKHVELSEVPLSHADVAISV